MDLITKNKVVEYIKQNPGVKTAMALWFNEFGYHPYNSLTGIAHGSGQISNTNYSVEFIANNWLKTACIVWIGTSEELKAYRIAKMERIRAENPNERFITTATTVIRSGKNVYKPAEVSPEHKDLIARLEQLNIDNPTQFSTYQQYKDALNRATTLIEFKPGTPEFNELAALLPSIKKYEQENITLPKLDILTVIRIKITERGYVPQDFIRLLGLPEEDIILMLEGKRPMPESVIKKLFKRFRTEYYIKDRSIFN